MIKSITVTIDRLINLGNYENVKYACSVTSTVEPTESPTVVYNEALNFCKQKLEIEIDRFAPKQQIKGLKSKQPIMDDEIPF